jgi:hypothetical protein
VCREEGTYTESRVIVAVYRELRSRKLLLLVGLLLVNVIPQIRLDILV